MAPIIRDCLSTAPPIFRLWRRPQPRSKAVDAHIGPLAGGRACGIAAARPRHYLIAAFAVTTAAFAAVKFALKTAR